MTFDNLKAEEPQEGQILAGIDEPTLCSIGAGGGHSRAARHTWLVTLELLKWEQGLLTAEVNWERYFREADGMESIRVVGDRRVVTLPEGGRHFLDFIQAGSRETSPDCDAVNLLVELEAGVKEDPALAHEIIRYDVWLIHRFVDGHETTRHFTSVGTQGGIVGFRFQPVRFLVEAAPSFEVALDVLGEVRGRIRRDGKIDLDINTSRRNGLAEVGQPLHGFTAEGGRKEFTVAPEEAVQIVLPEAMGYSRTPLPAAHRAAMPGAVTSTGQAVELREGWIQINHALFFEGHETSLTVRAERQR